MMKILQLSLYSFLILTLAAGCTKKEIDPAPKKTVKQTDQSGSGAVDGALDDVNDFVNNGIGGGSNSRMAKYNLPCGVVSIDSTGTGSQKTYYMKYGSQTPCGYKKKSGEVSFQLVSGNSFADINAVFATTFKDYVVEALATGEIVKINGTIYVTNINGGYIWQTISASKIIKHRIRGKFFITYANNEVRERNYFQLRTWSSSSGWSGLTLEVAGDTVIGSNNVSETGKTIDGNRDFKTEILTDFLWSNCGTTYAGPYVLKTGLARWNVVIPDITPTYFELEAGYKYSLTNTNNTPVKVNDCESNAYKIKTTIGAAVSTEYQLY